MGMDTNTTDAANRKYIHGAGTPAEVFARVADRMGTPTRTELNQWVMSVLGPWHIPAEVGAQCKPGGYDGVRAKDVLAALDAATGGE